mmetsp:Transcript_27389/g.63234  ORF Transcript_27389/g.63234 Transcript_27389/m.63234 type:complete len:342 (-) Transcript_27389:210-1235(-)
MKEAARVKRECHSVHSSKDRIMSGSGRTRNGSANGAAGRDKAATIVGARASLRCTLKPIPRKKSITPSCRPSLVWKSSLANLITRRLKSAGSAAMEPKIAASPVTTSRYPPTDKPSIVTNAAEQAPSGPKSRKRRSSASSSRRSASSSARVCSSSKRRLSSRSRSARSAASASCFICSIFCSLCNSSLSTGFLASSAARRASRAAASSMDFLTSAACCSATAMTLLKRNTTSALYLAFTTSNFASSSTTLSTIFGPYVATASSSSALFSNGSKLTATPGPASDESMNSFAAVVKSSLAATAGGSFALNSSLATSRSARALHLIFIFSITGCNSPIWRRAST